MFQPTPEQQHAIDLAKQGKNLKLIAFAGAGKTATLKLIAENIPHKRGLYLAFNKSIADEAKEKMPSNVQSCTFHAKAYQLVPEWLKRKQQQNNALSVMDEKGIINAENAPCFIRYLGCVGFADEQSSPEVKEAGVLLLDDIANQQSDWYKKNKGEANQKARIAKDDKGRLFYVDYRGSFHVVQFIRKVVSHSLKSKEKDLTEKSIKDFFLKEFYIPLNAYGSVNPLAQTLYEYTHEATLTLLNFYMQSNYSIPTSIGFDIFVKLWQRQQPHLDYDFILYDEAQDADPVMLDILENQRQKGVQIILVGDPHQQIYEWRGAVNAMQNATKIEHTAYLTQSFRFGKKIAHLGDNVLSYLGEKNQLKSGRPDINDLRIVTNHFSQIVHSEMMDFLQILAEKSKIIKKILNDEASYSPLESRDIIHHSQAILCRTNIACFAFALYCHSEDRKFKINIDTKNTLEILDTISLLMKGEKVKELPKIFRENGITSLSMLEEYLRTAYNPDKDISYGYHLLLKYDKEIIEKTLSQATKDDPNAIYISTIHKAKGMEWHSVILADDLMDEAILTYVECLKNKEYNQEIFRLLYVALTRAKEVIIFSKKYELLEKILLGNVSADLMLESYEQFMNMKEKNGQKLRKSAFYDRDFSNNHTNERSIASPVPELVDWQSKSGFGDYQHRQTTLKKRDRVLIIEPDNIDGQEGEVYELSSLYEDEQI